MDDILKEMWDSHWNQDYYIASLEKYEIGHKYSALNEDGSWKINADYVKVFSSVKECIDKTCNETGSWHIYKVKPSHTLIHQEATEWLTTQFEIIKYVRTVSVMS